MTKIVITQAHIDNGNPVEPSSCPIALALYDIEGIDGQVTVNHGYIEVTYNRKDISIRTPTAVSAFLDAVDWPNYERGIPRPFTFEIDFIDIYEA